TRRHMAIFAEYIWIDGTKPTKQPRSKTRILPDEAVSHSGNAADLVPLGGFPVWGADGSSTNQAAGKDSDIGLVPVRAIVDPIRGGRAYLVLCEVLSPQGSPHETNTRSELRRVLDAGAGKTDALFGFE